MRWASSCPSADEKDRPGVDLSGAEDERAAPAAQDLPLPAAAHDDRAAEPGLVCGRDLHPDAARLPLPRCHHRLGKPQSPRLAAVEHHGRRVLLGSAGGGDRSLWQARHLQHRSGQPVHQLAFTNTLKDAGIRISMDGRGRWMDNVFIERLWRSLKYECVFLNAFETGSEAGTGIGRWIGYYNAARPHSTFGGRTPDEIYVTELQAEKLAA